MMNLLLLQFEYIFFVLLLWPLQHARIEYEIRKITFLVVVAVKWRRTRDILVRRRKKNLCKSHFKRNKKSVNLTM